MGPLVVLLALAAPTAPPAFDGSLKLFDWGRDPGRGVLVNRTLGARPTDPIDPGRPTVAVVHGLNPFDPVLHFTLARRYAEALAGRGVNVLEWDWNADTMRPLRPGANNRHAIGHGLALADALRRAGVDPARLHLIGQSSGCLAVAAAARVLADGGRPPAQLTLLDPAAGYHDLVFGALGAGTAAAQVENIWAAGPSGYGRAAPYPGVRNVRIAPARGVVGLLRPMHSDHLNAARWHIGRMGR